MRLVKCAKNHFYDADRYCNCPLCNQSFEKSYGRSPYIWNSSTMDIKDLKSFEISFGNYPTICISYDGEKLTVHNRSGTTYNEFPDGFYDDKTVELSDVQKASIINYINAIDFSTWKTNENARKNYEMGACGFCIHNSFTITFNNGELFKCYEPKCEQFKLLAEFLQKFCDSSWFEVSFDKRVNAEKETILSKSKYASDADYVCLPSNMTRMLFDNTLKLYDVDTGLNVEFCNEKIDVGRHPNCELNIDDNYVSKMHASFYHEDSSWFISDKGSRNGTWLNNKKLAKNTKYELCPGDVISFAKKREYVFYKPKEDKARKHNESELLEVLHKALYHVWQNDGTEALKVVALLLAKLPMYFSMDYDFYEMFGNINPLELKKGDVIKTTKDVKMKILTLQIDNEEIIPMFTTSEQAHKGPSVNISRLYPQDYLPLLISMNKSIAINPFDEKAVSLKPAFFKDIVIPLVQSMMQDNESSKKENLKEVSVGSVIDKKYELLSLVGQGGTTKVYLAKDKRINRQWAVKILRNDLQNYVQSKNALLREAQMLKRLNHPAIPNIVDIIDSKEYFAIIMEYVEGVSLDAIVENYGKQSVENIIDWSIQICDVLGYLHSQSPPYIYRDMKPSNVILKPDGHISLIDFGIMRTYKPNNLADTVCLGTAGFAAPEQFGTAQTDCRSDIYALGMTMYNLFVGMRPKKNTSISFDNERDSLSRGLISIIKKCTELNRDDRYQSCVELRDELDYLKKNKKLKKRFKLFG